MSALRKLIDIVKTNFVIECVDEAEAELDALEFAKNIILDWQEGKVDRTLLRSQMTLFEVMLKNLECEK